MSDPSIPVTVTTPADLLLRVTRTPTGLRFSSPQLPKWAAVVRGPVPIAQAVDVAWQLLASSDASGHDDLARWDAAADLLAGSGHTLDARDVIVVREGARVRPAVAGQSGGADRHDPWAWTDNGDGTWTSPNRNVYRADSRQVRCVVAARDRRGRQQTLEEAG